MRDLKRKPEVQLTDLNGRSEIKKSTCRRVNTGWLSDYS